MRGGYVFLCGLKARSLQRGLDELSRQLGLVIAKEKGIEVGKSYRVIPLPGRAYKVVVKEIGPAHTDGENISVFCYLESKRSSRFGAEWIYTSRAEFMPLAWLALCPITAVTFAS